MIKIAFKVTAFFIIMGSLTTAWYWSEYKIFLKSSIHLPESEMNSNYIFTINKGNTVKQIAQSLQQKEIIQYGKYFYLYSRLSEQAGKIKAGEYALKSGMTVIDLMNLFVSGKVTQYSLTIVEGWSFKEAIQQISQDNYLTHSEPLTISDLSRQLDSQYNNLEGLIYPDTYHFPKGTTGLQFLQRAYVQMQLILEQEWNKKAENLPLKSPYEALILASIVEKESGGNSERSKIAGVFIRRLNKKMRLQSDPTIIYGMGTRYKGNIRRRDINEKTAYNTYQIDGLPPTPIALVGREAIHAVLHPDEGKSLYFVADGSGGHVFSNNLKEHNRAVRKYILKKK
ncbi:MAG: endolytic transglycosylase MltG [gamma proteobacterium symbiont of Taylorina sp.]|nr:endolytic transglycosylase MltG [gamma proteobacterium symbiont of Taylorina sp.]